MHHRCRKATVWGSNYCPGLPGAVKRPRRSSRYIGSVWCFCIGAQALYSPKRRFPALAVVTFLMPSAALMPLEYCLPLQVTSVPM
jgi:hypothetical protein